MTRLHQQYTALHGDNYKPKGGTMTHKKLTTFVPIHLEDYKISLDGQSLYKHGDEGPTVICPCPTNRLGIETIDDSEGLTGCIKKILVIMERDH